MGNSTSTIKRNEDGTLKRVLPDLNKNLIMKLLLIGKKSLKIIII